jgi:5-methylcytosine-specific restriction endonuclease McrA
MSPSGTPFWHFEDSDLEPADAASDGSAILPNHILPHAASAGHGPHAAVLTAGLDAKVLVLNKLFMAIRVVSARRAFSMLVRDLAEVIHIEHAPASTDAGAAADAAPGNYVNYDFESWAEISEVARQVEPDKYDWVRTVRLDIAVPRVIRLLGYDRLPAQMVKLNRRNLFARDRNQCQYCGNHFPTSELSIDHVKPRSKGGGDTWENLVCACIRCNARKGGRNPDGAGMKLIRKPVMPRRNPLIAIRLGQDRYASWKAFLDNAYWSVELK